LFVDCGEFSADLHPGGRQNKSPLFYCKLLVNIITRRPVPKAITIIDATQKKEAPESKTRYAQK